MGREATLILSSAGAQQNRRKPILRFRGDFRWRDVWLNQAAMRAERREMARLVEEPDALPFLADQTQVF